MQNEIGTNQISHKRCTATKIILTGGAGAVTTLCANSIAKGIATAIAEDAMVVGGLRNSIFKEGAKAALDAHCHEIKFINPTQPLDSYMRALIKASESESPSLLARNYEKVIGGIQNSARKIGRKIIPNIMEFMDKKDKAEIYKFLKSVINGENAGCLNNSITVNLDKLAASTFHEMGHASNYNCKGLGKVLQLLRESKCKHIGLGLAFAGAILVSSKEPENESGQPQGFWTKTKRFIGKNCVGIAALSCAPEILEEGLASVKGAKIAKSVLSKDAYKMVNSLNRKAWLTYLAGGAALTLGVFVTKKIRSILDRALTSDK